MKKLKSFTHLNDKQILSREELKSIKGASFGCNSDPFYGTPGGNNGNPCPEYCEPVGGHMMCFGCVSGVPTIYSGNCNEYGNPSEMHNVCMAINGNFWC